MANAFQDALEQSAQMSIALAAKLTGIPAERIAEMMAEAIPKLMEQAKQSPEAAVAAFKQSFEMLPEPLQQFYEKLGSAAAANGVTMEDFAKLFSQSAESMQKVAASWTDTTIGQAGAVFGAAVPALEDAMRRSGEAAGMIADSIDPAKAQELMGQAAEATRSVFNRLAGR